MNEKNNNVILLFSKKVKPEQTGDARSAAPREPNKDAAIIRPLFPGQASPETPSNSASQLEDEAFEKKFATALTLAEHGLDPEKLKFIVRLKMNSEVDQHKVDIAAGTPPISEYSLEEMIEFLKVSDESTIRKKPIFFFALLKRIVLAIQDGPNE